MLTNETVFKTNLLILHPTCPGAGKQTKLPADNWYSINICCKNKWSYINEQILKKKKECMIPVVLKHSKQQKVN